MTARIATLGVMVLLLTHGVLPLAATAPVPRVSPELKLLAPSDAEILLSSFKGKVVVIEFLLTNCPHCMRVAQTIDKLQRDLGPRGFQAIGVAFENNLSGEFVANFAHDSRLTYPVGHTSSDQVDSYLGRTPLDRFQVPQLVVIDRQGVIRAQSRAVGETNLESEAYLRGLIGDLLIGGGLTWTSALFRFSVAIPLVLGGLVVWKMRRKRSERRAGFRVAAGR